MKEYFTDDDTITASTVTASELALPCLPSKQRKLTPVDLTVLYYNTVDVVIFAANPYP